MKRTMAQELREEGRLEGKKEGRLEGKREALVRQMRRKFPKLPAAIAARVNATTDDRQLNQWPDEILPAGKLADMTFNPAS